jgi:steroid 5-alpha reductase family enzyme
MEIKEIFADSIGLAYSAIGLFSLFTITWIISIPMENIGIIDIIWGLSFVIQSIITYAYYASKSSIIIWEVILFTFLITFHGLRLSIYLAVRNCGHEEDRRYKILFREKYPEKIWWLSYFLCFLPQLIISFIVGFTIFSFNTIVKENKINLPAFIFGIFIMLFSTIYESIADQQLYNFKKNPENKGKCLDSGLWYYSRHPNYFGESLFWVGVYIVNLSALIYYTIFGSLLMILVINFVSGTPITEKNIQVKSNEYKKYIRTTSTFWPWCKFKDTILEENDHLPVNYVNYIKNIFITNKK